ncbi:hypothetical protein LCGC14_1591240 [marine sediment metagenome]|uniref:Uncharacterized protein n=1 Tax=marine sediment metagenome TaxID=412755 RepID=A0A0F9IE98_9ZZZZ
MLALTEEQIKMIKEEAYSTTIKRIRDMAETLLAVETLEYHDMNWLSGDPKTRNEQKQVLIRNIIAIT